MVEVTGYNAISSAQTRRVIGVRQPLARALSITSARNIMKHLNLLPLFLVCVYLMGCSNPTIDISLTTKKSGIVYYGVPDGSTGMPVTGVLVAYHENGNLKFKQKYKDGKAEGRRKRYHENGQLSATGTYKDGKHSGPYTSYFENGQLRSVFNYKNGKQDGTTELYYENSQLLGMLIYKDGKLVSFESYNEEGVLIKSKQVEEAEQDDEEQRS